MNKPSNAKIVDLNKYKNYSTLPITNMISSTVSTASSTSSTPSSASLSPSSSSSINSANYKQVPLTNIHATTLSQAFEAANNLKLSTNPVEKAPTDEIISNKICENSLILNNANSCDLKSLLDKENFLLEQGLNKIELVKSWYQIQVKENKIKQANIQKLKHQNLFSIDKMLIDLKQLNDLNETFSNFLNQNNPPCHTEQRVSSVKGKENSPVEPNPLPAYHEYIEQFDLSKKENDLDKFLKEKQEKIEYLQKEKSQLIRKLFEMKSESANKNIYKLQDGPSSDTAKIQVINKQNETSGKSIPIKFENRNVLQSKNYVENKNLSDLQLKNQMTYNCVEMPSKNGYYIQNVSLNK
jgi:hypothetical protein